MSEWAETVRDLQALKVAINRLHTFAPGGLVRFKPGLRPGDTPAFYAGYGEPLLVLEFPQDVMIPTPGATPRRVVVGSKVGLLDHSMARGGKTEMGFQTMTVESWRLEPFTDEEV